MPAPVPPTPEQAATIPHPDRRCRRGHRCARRDTHTFTTGGPAACSCRCHAGGGVGAVCDLSTGCADTHTDTTEQTVAVGALLEDPTEGFCPRCTSLLAGVLDGLPRLFVAVHSLHDPSLAVRYRTDDITGGDLHSPTLLNDHADALTRLLDHELETWSEVVAAIAGVPWDTRAAATSRPGHRVQLACQLLGYRIVQWLAAPEHDYLARSLTDDPTDGHDPDTTTRYGRDWWCRRDGPTAAAAVMQLHGQAERLTGGAPADREPVPCGYCGHRTLYRQHFDGIVRCRTCGDTKSDDAHDAFLEAALASLTIGAAA